MTRLCIPTLTVREIAALYPTLRGWTPWMPVEGQAHRLVRFYIRRGKAIRTEFRR